MQFVDDAKGEIARFIGLHQFSRRVKLLYDVLFTAALVAIALPLALWVYSNSTIHPYLAARRVPAGDLVYYVPNGPTGFFPLALFLFFLVVAVVQMVARSNDEFAAYAMKEFKIGKGDTEKTTVRRLGDRLARLIEKKQMSLLPPFEPRAFLIDSYRAKEKWVYPATAVLAIAAIGLTANDYLSYTALTRQEVIAARWWQLETVRRENRAVESVRVACRIPRFGRDPAWFNYELTISPDIRVDLFNEHALASHLDNIPWVDQTLKDATVAFTYETTDHGSDKTEAGISSMCAERLKHVRRAETRPIIRRLISSETGED